MEQTYSEKVLAGRTGSGVPVEWWVSVDNARAADAVRVGSHAEPAPEPATQGDHRSLLEVFDLIPDILSLAAQEEDSAEGFMDVRDRLVDGYRSEGAPFKWSIPAREPRTCTVCGAVLTTLGHELENPAQMSDSPLRDIHVEGLTLHNVRCHSGLFPDEVAAFLEGVRRTWSGEE
jgi:hypothetical protein